MSLKDVDWDELLYSINRQECTPFIGAGASAFQNEQGKPWLPLGNTISIEMAKEYEYPLSDVEELDRVSQFAAIEHGDMVPKNFIVRWLNKIAVPDFSLEKYRNTPHSVLADLNLPIYITTNYDEFMESALKSRGKTPDSEFSRWNQFLNKQTNIHSVFEKIDYKPEREKPLVYHLHGQISYPRSMVLTETDYIEFLINLSKEEILPYQINTALNFRFIFKGLMQLLGEGLGSGLQLPSIAVQLPSGFTQEKKEQALRYLDNYTKNMFKVRVYWGDITKFAAELRERWEKFKNVK